MRKRMKGLLSAALAVSVMLLWQPAEIPRRVQAQLPIREQMQRLRQTEAVRSIGKWCMVPPSMITSFDMKNITSANDLQAADQVYDTLVRKINHEIVGYLQNPMRFLMMEKNTRSIFVRALPGAMEHRLQRQI